MENLEGLSADTKIAAVKGTTTAGGGFGVWGICDTGHGVHGDSKTSRGVVGTSLTFSGVYGKSNDSAGVEGESQNNHAIFGHSHFAKGAGVLGMNDKGGDGVMGIGRRGVVGISTDFQGVFGKSTTNAGIVGESDHFHAVFAVSHSVNNAGVIASNDKGGFGVIATSDNGIGIFAKGGKFAGQFEGNVRVSGDIIMPNADCAEDFDIAGATEAAPGTVMVLDNGGSLSACDQAYDKRVAGVISGAGDYNPAIVLDRQQKNAGIRQPVGLMGKVYCKVDARFGPIEIGDLLTTSPTPGHAMKAGDPSKSFGSVIGKALRQMPDGQGMIPILITLQ